MIAKFLADNFVSVRGGFALKRGSQAIANKNYGHAIQAFREAVAAKTEHFGTHRHLSVAQAMAELADAHRLAGQCEEAAQVLIDVVEVYQENNASELPVTMNNLATMLRDTDKHEEARSVYLEAMRLLGDSKEDLDLTRVRGVEFCLVAVNAARNELEVATKAWSSLIQHADVPTRNRGEDVGASSQSFDNSSSRTAWKAVGEAESLLRRVVSERRKALPIPNPELSGLMEPDADEALAEAMGWLGHALTLKSDLLLAEEEGCSSADQEGIAGGWLEEAARFLAEAHSMQRQLQRDDITDSADCKVRALDLRREETAAKLQALRHFSVTQAPPREK